MYVGDVALPPTEPSSIEMSKGKCAPLGGICAFNAIVSLPIFRSGVMQALIVSIPKSKNRRFRKKRMSKICLIIISSIFYLASATNSMAQNDPKNGANFFQASVRCFLYLKEIKEVKSPEEQKNIAIQGERLFRNAYAEGKAYLEWVRRNPKKVADSTNVIYILMMSGPSDDFILGRWFESTNEYENDVINQRITSTSDAKYIIDKEFRGREASRLYNDQNCELIGR